MSQLPTSENLSLAQKKRLHKDFVENERLYWRMRGQLLEHYRGQWVAAEGGRVVASGDSLFDTLQDPQAPVDWFQRGENGAIALAIENGYFLLIDDANPYHLAKSQGLKVVGTMDFTVFLYDQGKLSSAAAMSTLKVLRASDKLKRDAMITLEILARAKGEKDATK